MNSFVTNEIIIIDDIIQTIPEYTESNYYSKRYVKNRASKSSKNYVYNPNRYDFREIINNAQTISDHYCEKTDEEDVDKSNQDFSDENEYEEDDYSKKGKKKR